MITMRLVAIFQLSVALVACLASDDKVVELSGNTKATPQPAIPDAAMAEKRESLVQNDERIIEEMHSAFRHEIDKEGGIPKQKFLRDKTYEPKVPPRMLVYTTALSSAECCIAYSLLCLDDESHSMSLSLSAQR